jgi:hypothetical protein
LCALEYQIKSKLSELKNCSLVVVILLGRNALGSEVQKSVNVYMLSGLVTVHAVTGAKFFDSLRVVRLYDGVVLLLIIINKKTL